MKAVVTGGAGFIGSHMVDLLVANNFDVIVVDNLVNGRLSNLAHVKQDIEFIETDIANPNIDLVQLLEDVDYVFHFAALADIVPSIQSPGKYHDANVNGTLNILEASRHSTALKKFIYAASSSCYGIPDVYPTPENTAIKPEYPYALTKNIGEQYALHWGQVYDLPVISMRFFNVYGLRHRTSGAYGAVFGVFLAQILNNKPLTIVGNGEQTRDFTYVTDVVDACFTASKSEYRNEVFNVGSGNTYSINYLAELLGGDKTYIPRRPGEPDCTFADITKINTKLHWSPKVSIEEGVKIMLENIHLWSDAPVWNESSIEEATKDWFKHLSK
ncbi:NAD-dependent epimerase/dehydratase family protein [Thalassotalea euphylliae]|uniref:NAD-dependent epimerase/dehydratase family protein n=1 Tax=Thalassotalea euphylliae TaxID=1655234 RepID=A0A3E0TNY0_9GAMM|nr:SDR family oxidoreductase [Thalassotalea euphylliae]REL26057.1 NAD-dependent epimerase/dehydratase family protein [Thalassotalea euphylliae]